MAQEAPEKYQSGLGNSQQQTPIGAGPLVKLTKILGGGSPFTSWAPLGGDTPKMKELFIPNHRTFVSQLAHPWPWINSPPVCFKTVMDRELLLSMSLMTQSWECLLLVTVLCVSLALSLSHSMRHYDLLSQMKLDTESCIDQVLCHSVVDSSQWAHQWWCRYTMLSCIPSQLTWGPSSTMSSRSCCVPANI